MKHVIYKYRYTMSMVEALRKRKERECFIEQNIDIYNTLHQIRFLSKYKKTTSVIIAILELECF